MRFYLLFVIILQFKSIYNKDSDCGCNVNREYQEHEGKDSLFGSLMDKEQCQSKLNCFDNNEEDITNEMILIPGGFYQVGTDDIVIESDKEGPKNLVELKSFYLDKYEVSNKDFDAFTKSTDYKTEAETFGDSFVFTLFLNNTFKEKLKDFRVAQAPWWYKVSSASWYHPFGPDSDNSG